VSAKNRDAAWAELATVAEAARQPNQPQPLFQALDLALGRVIGHKLFTLLVYHPKAEASERYYTNQPAAYPVGGRKPRPKGPWADALLERGVPYIGRTADDIRSVFFDHELIRSLGCDSVLNLPVRYDGRPLGTINLLHQALWYDERDGDIGLPFAQLAVPAYLALADRS
jgi:hypothetical protein